MSQVEDGEYESYKYRVEGEVGRIEFESYRVKEVDSVEHV